jgi:uncharacterized membrane protein SirB2
MTARNQGGATMRWILVGVGIVLILLGGLWLLQGVGILAGSVMTGQMFWAIVGLILLIVGIVLCALGLRRRPPTPSI